MKVIATDKAPAAIGPYSQAYCVNGLLFTSGQIALNPATGEIVGTDIEAQAEQCCKNVGAILEAAGTDFSKVVKTTCFLADMKDFAAFNAVYAKSAQAGALRDRDGHPGRLIPGDILVPLQRNQTVKQHTA